MSLWHVRLVDSRGVTALSDPSWLVVTFGSEIHEASVRLMLSTKGPSYKYLAESRKTIHYQLIEIDQSGVSTL